LRILLLGSTGRVGTQLLQLLLANGHQVTAFVRDPNRLKYRVDGMAVYAGNALNKVDIEMVMPNHDIVLSAMGTDGKETLSVSMPYIIDAMVANRISRIISVGTAGILKSRISPELYRFQSTESRRRSPKSTRAAEDHKVAYEALANSSLEWTVVCPTYLPDGEAVGNYRFEVNFLPINGEKISVGDTAQFTYKQINSEEFLRCRVGLAY
jgi:uncharacterized protein